MEATGGSFWDLVQAPNYRVVCLEATPPASLNWVVDNKAVFGREVVPGQEVLRPREDARAKLVSLRLEGVLNFTHWDLTFDRSHQQLFGSLNAVDDWKGTLGHKNLALI